VLFFSGSFPLRGKPSRIRDLAGVLIINADLLYADDDIVRHHDVIGLLPPFLAAAYRRYSWPR